jgi:NlpC/P60 family putative phage cell wall peptidase
MMVLGERIVCEARLWIGTPYVHQASCRGAGTDCLGLILGLWRALFGVLPTIVPAYTADWSEPTCREDLMQAAQRFLRPVAGREPMAGDVLLFRMRDGRVAKHLGVQSEVGVSERFIHAYSGHGVVESALTDPWRRRIAARFEFPNGAI